MRRRHWISAVAAIAWLSAGAAGAQQASTAVNIMQATAALQGNNCAEALPILAQLWDDKALQASDPELAGEFRAKRVLCTAELTGPTDALALSTQNLTMAPVSVDAWGLQIYLQLGTGQTAAAGQTLNAALTQLGPKATELNDLSVIGTLALLNANNPAAANTLMGRLEDAGWQVHDVTSRQVLDVFRLEGLRAAVASGDTARAAAYRADLQKDAAIYVLSQGDGAVSRGDVPPADVKPMLAAEIDTVKRAIIKNPADLSAISYLIGLETTDGQEELALKQVNAMITLIDQNKLSSFQNVDSYADLLSQKASLLADLGKTEEADAAYVEGEARLNGHGTVGFYVAELGYLIDRGREKDALALFKRFDVSNLRPDQKTAIAALVACAAVYSGDQADYQAILGHMTGDSMAKIRPLVCAGDKEAAARTIIALVGDAASRDLMITFLQNRQPGIAWGARDQIYIDNLEALRKRGDVLAAGTQANILVRNWPIRF